MNKYVFLTTIFIFCYRLFAMDEQFDQTEMRNLLKEFDLESLLDSPNKNPDTPLPQIIPIKKKTKKNTINDLQGVSKIRRRERRNPNTSYCYTCIFEKLKTSKKLTQEELGLLTFRSFTTLRKHNEEYNHDTTQEHTTCLKCNTKYSDKYSVIDHVKNIHVKK